MVENICVVSCCFCETFQGQHVKKEKKWTCKMCGQKQSFRKIFTQGSGKECRIFVQKLNRMKGSVDEEKDEYLEQESKPTVEPKSERDNEEFRTTSYSKWRQFVQPEQEYSKDKESDQEDSFTTEREIFKKHKGEKRKKSKGQTILQHEWQDFPRKIPRHDTTTKSKETYSPKLLINECKKTEKNVVNTPGIDGMNRLSEYYCEYKSKENESQAHQSSSFSSSQLIGHTKLSKWLKYT